MVFATIIQFLIAIFVLLFLYIQKKYSYWENRNILFVKPTFPYGNLKGAGSSIHPALFFKKVYDDYIGKVLYVGVYFFIRPVLVILDPELVKKILVKDFHYFTDRGIYHNENDDPLSGHLFALKFGKWKNLRGKLTPTFTSGKLKMMFKTILDVAEELKKYIKPFADAGETIEIKDIFARFNTDIIGSCAFGLDCNSIKDPNAEFRLMGKKVFDTPAFQQFLVFFTSSFPNLSRKLGIKINYNDVSEFFLRIVKETIEYREKNKIERMDFMHLLIQLKNSENNCDNITFNEIAAQCFIFFLAGFETSSTTMTFCLYELARNIELQEKARDEIKTVLAKHDGKITYDSMIELTYMDMIINETMRKYPPIVNLTRMTTKQYPIDGTKDIIEEGTLITLPVYAVHHDPEIYPEPEIFDPERFNAENLRNRHPYTYLPFGEGPRNCIGMRFGLMQTKMGLVSMLAHYKLTQTEKTPKVIEYVPSAPVITSKDGVWLKVENIN